MSNIQAFGNTTLPPPRRGGTGVYNFTGTTAELIAELRPAIPVHILRPARVAEMAKTFVSEFPGHTVYAVKCNPTKAALQTLYRNGVRRFDVASIEEVRTVRRLYPNAELFYMHPVKSVEAIEEAYYRYNVRAFSLDTVQELYKIIRATQFAPDLKLFVRVAVDGTKDTKFALNRKFGALAAEAVELLQQCRPVCAKLGVAFHVGSQCLESQAYARAIAHVATLIDGADVSVDILDVGGGFPSTYPDMTPPPLSTYFAVIKEAIAANGLQSLELYAEPGRVMVADAGSLIVRVEQRRGNLLYLNDGTYGGLFDAGKSIGYRFPTTLHCLEGQPCANTAEFSFAGPTCDSVDMMEGPFTLPADVREGDWIEIGQLGAYSITMRTNFNGFGESLSVVMTD